MFINITVSNNIYAQDTPGANHMFSVSLDIKSPVRIAIDNEDIIYVTDAFQKCIVKYDTTGNFLGKIITGGLPISIAINDENQIFIGDGQTGEVLRLEGTGATTEFYTGTEFPSSMVAGPDGLLYVVDSELKQIVVLDRLGKVVRIIGRDILVLPTGIAYNGKNSSILVAEHGGIGTGFKPVVEVKEFDLQGNLIGSFGSHGKGDGKFYRIQGLAVGRCGKVYATDPFQATISVFSQAGFVEKFGKYGNKLGQLNAPMDIVIDSREHIWVTSMNNGSLEVFNIEETAPASNIIGTDTSICSGGSADIAIGFTGTAPWTFTYTVDGSNPATISNTTENPYILTVSEPGIYEVTMLSDANYVGTCFNGSVDISLNPLPAPEFTYTENYLEVSFLNNSKNAGSYFWDFGDNGTSEEINPVHIYKVPGEYKVELTASNQNCDDRKFSKTINILKVESIEPGDFAKIYPNPSNGLITVELNGQVRSGLRIEVTSMAGQKVYAKACDTQKDIDQIDLGSLSKGIYTLKLITEDLVRIYKIIINE